MIASYNITMAKRSLIFFVLLATLNAAQDLSPVVVPVPDIEINRCAEVSVGPSYFAPWFPWPSNCILIYAFIVWRPFPPRICYLYRCTFVFFGQKFYIYFRLCRRLLYRSFWNIDSAQLTPNNFDSYINSDTFASSSNVNDLLEGQTLPSSNALTCAFTASLTKEVQASTLGSTF